MLSILLICVFTNGALASLNLRQLPLEIRKLYVPPLEEIAEVLNQGLKQFYEEVKVEVVDCPDLREEPFRLAGAGLQGKTRIVEIGGAQYLMPYINQSKEYDLRHVVEMLELNSALLLGASAGPNDYSAGVCEGNINVNIMGDRNEQMSTITEVFDDASYVIKQVPNNDTRIHILADLYVTESKPGPVLKVYVRKRTGSEAFSVYIRKILATQYGSNIVGLGGAFVQLKGYAIHSLLPPLPKTPFNSWRDIITWIQPYNFSTPFTAVGMIITGKLGLDLRPQHFHTFSDHNVGGHYRIDSTPDTAEYIGYFNTAEYIYRFDKGPEKIVGKKEHIYLNN